MRRVLGLAFALALVATSACSDDGDDDANRPRTTVPTAPPPTTTTTPADAFAIPETIDEEYVQRVLDELNKLEGDATRLIVQNGDFVPEATDLLQAIYLPDELNAQLDVWHDLIVGGGLAEYRRPPGDVVSEIRQLHTASDRCIFVATTDDLSALAREPVPDRVNFWMLHPKIPSQDKTNRNHTPWMIALKIVSADGGTPEDRCSG